MHINIGFFLSLSFSIADDVLLNNRQRGRSCLVSLFRCICKVSTLQGVLCRCVCAQKVPCSGKGADDDAWCLCTSKAAEIWSGAFPGRYGGDC